MEEKRAFRLVHDDARKRAMAAVFNAPDGAVVEIYPDPTRTKDQNAKLHAMCAYIAKRKEWAGRKWNVEDWKRLLTAAWIRAECGQAVVIPAIDGAGVDVLYRRTSTLSVKQLCALIDYIESWWSDQPESENVRT